MKEFPLPCLITNLSGMVGMIDLNITYAFLIYNKMIEHGGTIPMSPPTTVAQGVWNPSGSFEHPQHETNHNHLTFQKELIRIFLNNSPSEGNLGL